MRIGGLGIDLVRKFTRQLGYARVGAWNRLRFSPAGMPPITGQTLATPQPGTPRVLVVDDNPLNCDLLSCRLRRMGLDRVDCVDNGEAAQRSHTCARTPTIWCCWT